jgi:hypothetical protein
MDQPHSTRAGPPWPTKWSPCESGPSATSSATARNAFASLSKSAVASPDDDLSSARSEWRRFSWRALPCSSPSSEEAATRPLTLRRRRQRASCQRPPRPRLTPPARPSPGKLGQWRAPGTGRPYEQKARPPGAGQGRATSEQIPGEAQRRSAEALPKASPRRHQVQKPNPRQGHRAHPRQRQRRRLQPIEVQPKVSSALSTEMALPPQRTEKR